MKAIVAISRLTIHSCLRSHVVHVALFLLFATVVVFPLTLVGDGTAYGQLRLSLTYTLGAVSIILSMITLWLGCTVMADDIEGYQIHLVVTKPVSRAQFWCGKLLGLVGLQGCLLLVSALAVYAVVHWRLHTGAFADIELRRLNNEVLVGRRLFASTPINIDQHVQAEMRRRVETGQLSTAYPRETVELEIRRQIKARATEVPFGAERVWTFNGLPTLRHGDAIHFRYRMFIDKISNKKQRHTRGEWYIPHENGRVEVLPTSEMTGVYHEIVLRPSAIQDGRFRIVYRNLDPERTSVIVQQPDGPHLLMRVTGFWGNYARVIIVMLMQLVFLATVACTCGSSLSIPVAVFFASSYVVVGAALASMQPMTPDDDFVPPQTIQRIGYYVRQAANRVMVSVNEFNEIDRLVNGELIEFQRILSLFAGILVLRGLPIALLGIWFLNLRELGVVVRR